MKTSFKRILAIILSACMMLSLVSCGEEAEVDYLTDLTDQSLTYTLDELYDLETETLYAADYELPALYKYFEGLCNIGVAFTSDQIVDLEDDITKSILKHYRVYTLGNELKPDHVNPSEGEYNFDDADAFVEFGQLTDATLRGHTLVWHSQVPDWWFKADPSDESSLEDCYANGTLATSDQLIERMQEYITTVVSRYADTIDIWDVCNEVLNDSGTGVRSINDSSYWSYIIGDLDGDGYSDDYIQIAFEAARAANEDAVLMINDYNMEWSSAKCQQMYNLVLRMFEKGVRIDGVGFQSHIELDCDVETYRENLELIASLSDLYDEYFPEYAGNFRITITELDMDMFIGSNSDGGYYVWSDEEFEQQAEKYYELIDMFLDFADEGIIDTIIFWGTDDENSWLNSTPKIRRNASLLFDRDLSVKPCFYSVAEAALAHSSN